MIAAACILLSSAFTCALSAERHPDGTRSASVAVGGRTDRLPDGSSAVRGRAATGDGKYVFFVHNLARYHLPATQMDRGWMNSAALTVYDGATGRRISTVMLDDPLLGAANPWGVAVNEKWIAVTHAGTHELSLIDRARFFDRLLASREDMSGDLAFMKAVGRRRISFKGKGPRAVRFRADGKLEVWLHFAEAKAVVDPESGQVEEPNLPGGVSAAVARDRVRMGELHFNDATLCYQQWQSCASCHPDGTTDGLTWDFPFSGGGLGHPESTPDLTKPRNFAARRNRRDDFHIHLYSASPEVGAATDAYVRALAEKGRREGPCK